MRLNFSPNKKVCLTFAGVVASLAIPMTAHAFADDGTYEGSIWKTRTYQDLGRAPADDQEVTSYPYQGGINTVRTYADVNNPTEQAENTKSTYSSARDLANDASAPVPPQTDQNLRAQTNTTTDAYKADNTRVNQRDRSDSELTADNQSNTKADTEITRNVRRRIMRDRNLSTYAHNVKIITVNSEVTLKGPVRSRTEENAVLQKTRKTAGVSKVIDQLDVVTKSFN